MASKEIQFHTMKLEFQRDNIEISIESDGKVILLGAIGNKVQVHDILGTAQTSDQLSVEFQTCKLSIVHSSSRQHEHRYDFTWESRTCPEFVDEFDYQDYHWYGAAQVKYQHWPIEKWQRSLEPYICGDSYQDELGGVQERYWLCSSGAALFVDKSVPLFTSMNPDGNKKLSFRAKYEAPYTKFRKDLRFQYSIFQAKDVQRVHSSVLNSGLIEKPTDIPNEMIFRHPIWTTWARYKKDIDQKTVMEFAKEIKDNNFKASQLEIDDDWTPKYGDMTFDTAKFPDPKAMVTELNKMDFRVTLWVHPFCSLDSNATAKPYWLSGDGGEESTWWNGQGKCLDITNHEAVSWFKDELETLKKEYGITSFKFDAGEINWLPKNPTSLQKLVSPNEYATKWANIAYDLDTAERSQEVRVGLATQKLPIFVRMMDKDSNWGYCNGLKTLIPHCLTLGLIGYPFVLPDMIGGNAYKDEYPEPELFVRWLQVNLFMPALQFSICPWNYDKQILNICSDMMKLREKFKDMIIALAKESVETGFPINRPLWWIAPDDEVALTVDSEFLLGNELLVAPVLEAGATSRDVYLPHGEWLDEVTGKVIQGGRWYRDYPASLEVIPHFTRIKS